jgi:hypothetical protein
VLRLEEVKALLFLHAIGLFVYAVIDCSRTPEDEIPSGLPRTVWLVLIVILPILGPVFWLVVSRSDRANQPGGPPPRGRSGFGGFGGPGGPGGAGGRGPTNRGAARPRGPVGPDDDPEFLHGL